MTINEDRHRVGFIRISGTYWSENRDKIRECLGNERIVNVLQAIQDGRYLNAVDVLIEDPQLDEIETGGSIPHYAFDLPTGRFTRVPDDKLAQASFFRFDDEWV